MKTLIVHIFGIFFSSLILFISKPKIDDYLKKKRPVTFSVNYSSSIDHFNYLNPDVNLAISNSIKSGVPTVFGSSELSSNHLKGVCYNFFKEKNIKIQTIGHAGFQCFAISSVLVQHALIRAETRGSHWREDYPSLESEFQVRLVSHRNSYGDVVTEMVGINS